MSDRIAVMQAGRIIQIGTPEEIYTRPVNRFVAEFMGEVNVIPVRRRADQVYEGVGMPGTFKVAGGSPGEGFIVVRPEFLRLLQRAGDAENVIEGRALQLLLAGLAHAVPRPRRRQGDDRRAVPRRRGRGRRSTRRCWSAGTAATRCSSRADDGDGRRRDPGAALDAPAGAAPDCGCRPALAARFPVCMLARRSASSPRCSPSSPTPSRRRAASTCSAPSPSPTMPQILRSGQHRVDVLRLVARSCRARRGDPRGHLPTRSPMASRAPSAAGRASSASSSCSRFSCRRTSASMAGSCSSSRAGCSTAP